MEIRFYHPSKVSKLNQRMILRIMLISSLITAVITITSFVNDYKRDISQLEKTLHQIENTNLKSFKQSLWEVNSQQLSNQFEGLLTIQNIYSIYHTDKSGKISLEMHNKGITPTYPIYKKIPLTFSFEKSLLNLGHITIVAYKDNIYENLLGRALYVFVTQVLKTMLVALAMYLTFTKYFSNHITSITEYFSNINLESDKSFPVLKLNKKTKDNDELDQLAHSINNMTELVAKANQKKTTLIQNQEKRIEQQELMAINSSRLAALGEMAAGIAHEINNPAAIIFLSTRSIKKDLDHHHYDRDNLSNRLDKIEKSITRITNIINSIKAFSRNTEADTLKKENITEVISDTLNFCRERFKSENLNLIVDIPSAELFVHARHSEISQVILNLINNAYDAISEEQNKWIKVELIYDQKNINLIISDSGAGIPEKIRLKIFDPFFTTKEVGKGTGIGLSLSKKLIGNNNGTLTLDNKKNHTTFIITLPLDRNTES